MDISVSVAAKVADYMVASVVRQVGYLLFYRENVKELADQVAGLEAATYRIKHLVEAEVRNGNEISADVCDWLRKVEDIIDEASLVLAHPNHAKVGCSCRCSFPDLWSQHRLSRQAKRMAIHVARMLETSKFDRVGSYLPGGILMLESRQSLQENMVEALRYPKVSKVGVYGLAGVGKTTLLKQVAEQLMREKLFDVIIMISLSQTSDIKTIQSEIAEMLGLRLEEITEAARAQRLYVRMTVEKSILIIMDDIWAALDLEMLGIPSVDGHVGCKQLLTSRNRDVLLQMDTQQDFRLEVLSEEEMWSFFREIGGEVVEDAILLRNIAHVAREYAGLPDLAARVALALRNKDIHSCKYALNQLERFNDKQKNEIICSAVELSYSQLESDEVKALFLLCGVLGTSSFIGDLLKFGIGLDIFKHISTLKDARNELYKMISALKEDCLLLEENNRSDQVKLHDIVYEVAISIAAREKLVFTNKSGAELKEWPSEDFLKRCTQIIIDGCYIPKLPERLDCPELKLLYINSAKNDLLKMPDSFFHGMGGLQVLGLTCMNMSSLPTSLCSLIKLKTLCLDQCALQDMAGIGALKNLEILSLTNSSFEFSYEFEQLTGLKMLDLSLSRIKIIPPKIISNWFQLEELYTGKTFIEWQFEDSSLQKVNASLAELKLLPNLTDLDIKIPHIEDMPRDNLLILDKLDRFKITVGYELECSETKYHFSKTLELQLGTSVHLEDWVTEVIKRVDDLWLGQINGISNVLYQLNREGLPLLKHLYIQNNATIRHITNSVDVFMFHDLFPNLETMVLHNLNYLDEICHGPLSVDSFNNLRVIKVKRCNRLQNIFSSSMFKGLPSLLEIEVSKCNSLKEITALRFQTPLPRLRSLTLQHLPALLGFMSYELTSPQTQQKPFFNSEYSLPNLETVKLCSIKLKKIFGDEISLSLAGQLTSFILEDCSDLKYVFPSHMVESFIKLSQLEISKCHMMEELIKATKKGADNREVVFPNLKILRLRSLNLKNIWDKEGQLSATSLRNLTSLILEDCDDLTFLFSSSIVRSLSKLGRLEISKCHKMEQILKATDEGRNKNEALFPFLETIIISDMENLKTMWQLHQPPAPNSFSRLRMMVVKNCEKLDNIFSINKSLKRSNTSMAAKVEA